MLFPFDNSYARLPDAFFTPIDPTPVSAPVMIRLNHDLANELGIDAAHRLFNQPEAIVAWLSAWRARLHDVDRSQAIALMRRTNPIFIPRNHRIEEAIQAGNGGDFEPFHRLHQVLRHPFTEQAEFTVYEAAPAPHEVVQATFCGT